MQKITSPHDKFFRQTMSNQSIAQAFFAMHLPTAIKELVDLNSLQLRNESHVDSDLKLTQTDMLFSVQLANKPGYLYLLAEHQSTSDKWMPLRLLKYTLKILEQHRKETGDESLPIVYPLIFYNGRKKYSHSTDIMTLFNDPALAEKILFKPFQLIDVTQIPDEKLKQEVGATVLQLCMKHIFARDILLPLQQLLIPLRQLEEMGNIETVRAALTYLMTASKTHNKKEFVETIKLGLSTNKRGKSAMTIMEWLQENNRAEGKIEGLIEGKKEIACKLLQRGMSLEAIKDITGLSLDEIQALEATDIV